MMVKFPKCFRGRPSQNLNIYSLLDNIQDTIKRQAILNIYSKINIYAGIIGIGRDPYE
jgi:hypothetical protein